MAMLSKRPSSKKSSAHLVYPIPSLITVSMGQGESTPDKVNLDVYKNKFQEPFINATAAYYQHESTNFLATQSVVDYMIRAESRLAEESTRVDLFLHNSTKKPLLAR